VIGNLDRNLGRPFADLGDRALKDGSVASQQNDPTLLFARAWLYTQRGEWSSATADLEQIYKSAFKTNVRWFLAGSWVVGPYPMVGSKVQEEVDRSFPPEKDPSPDKQVTGPDGKSSVAWELANLSADGRIDLTPFLKSAERASVYVLTRVYSAEERSIIALVANDDWLRLWCNGVLVKSQGLLFNSLTPVPLRLRPGWNTILAKVVNWEGAAFLTLKLSENYEEVARNFAVAVKNRGWSNETAALLEQLYNLVPSRHGEWDNTAEELAAMVAERDVVFERVIASRPYDSLLRQARGRYLAWLGKWNEALAEYDRMIHDHPAPEDAFVEYAAVLLQKGDLAGYQKWAAQVCEKFAKTPGPFVGTMLVRCCGMNRDSGIEPSRLIPWAEQTAAKQPKAATTLHCIGLALLRAGHLTEAVTSFQASIDAGEDSPWNWYGLAIAQAQLAHSVDALVWLDKAKAWMEQKELEFADRTIHRTPPIYIAFWLETNVLRREAEALFENRRLGVATVLDQTAVAGKEFRFQLGAVNLRRDPPGNLPGSMTIAVPFQLKAPFADGVIRANEYGPPLKIDFTGDANPGRLWNVSKPVKDAIDLSAELFLAYTKTDLFIAARVYDDKLVASTTDAIYYGDSVEIYLDGDRQANDFDGTGTETKANHEGFEIGTDFRSERYVQGVSFNDYAVAAARCEGGYVVEYRIPLETIDTDDGAEVRAAGPGSTVRFNLAINDTDEATDRYERFGILWTNDPSNTPYLQGEKAWAVDLHLARPIKYELVTGPTGAAVDSDTGLFTWNTPSNPQTANVAVRIRDVDKPDLTALVNFTITTKAK
jgi:tetratricopeptide (TPR) repeat protein